MRLYLGGMKSVTHKKIAKFPFFLDIKIGIPKSDKKIIVKIHKKVTQKTVDITEEMCYTIKQ